MQPLSESTPVRISVVDGSVISASSVPGCRTKRTNFKVSSRHLVNSNCGCRVPILLNPTSPVQTNMTRTTELKLRERRSLVGTHQQSWWFTEVNQQPPAEPVV